MYVTEIHKALYDAFVSDDNEEWVDISVNTLNLVSITIISNKFLNKDFGQRYNLVLDHISILHPYEEGFFEFYTYQESREEGITKPLYKENAGRPSTWQELSTNSKNEIKMAQSDSEQDVERSKNPKVVSFYSYKGGVGRTVALTHVAYILASRGKKVVIVDMDIEAPGMSDVFDPKHYQKPKFGIVDYLYDKVTKVNEIENRISITDIFSEVHLSDIPGRLFVIPAGELDTNYLGKVDNFRASNIITSTENYWDYFLKELNDHLKPDIVLIDSRTGISGWGALSILKISDKVLFFAYPNTENMNGLKVIIKAMRNVGYTNYNIIFSRIHDDKVGKKRVDELWDNIKNDIYGEPVYDDLGEKIQNDDPIKIYYSSELAVADYYPIPSAYHIFSQIANIADEEIEDDELIRVLSGEDRWQMVRDLPYENLGFSETENDPSLFQKTVYVDKFLDEDVSIVTGKKGTGKTKMYSMMLKHFDTLKSISRVNLEKVKPLSGHGDYTPRPIEEFDSWARLVEAGKCSWENIWRAYLSVVLQKNNCFGSNRNSKYKELKETIQPAKKNSIGWKAEDTEIVSKLSTDVTLSQILQDYFSDFDDGLRKKEVKLWIHYDKLDEDLEKKKYGVAAVEGLFKLVQIFEGRHIKNIKFKIFIRQDIWDSLGFTNKSHFKGKTIRLEWNQQDFLKLALKISFNSESFKQLVGKYKPIPQEIDYMDVEALKEALQLLWGIRRHSGKTQYVVNWIYERSTDADGNTFPRSLFMLLKGAKEQELTYEHSTYIQPPRDRLLRTTSLNYGLKEASIERCDALRQEYDGYKNAFNLFERFSDTFSYTDFENVYEGTKWDSKELLDILKKIGVISKKDDDIYKFAYIYIDGFKIKRTSKI